MSVEHRWRVPRKVPVGKLVVAAIVVVLGLAGATEGWQRGVAAAAVAGLVAWAARDLLAPVRLAADSAGVTVTTGFARRLWLPWSRVERVRVDVRRRSRVLEVDVGDTLYLFTRYDLGADPEDAVVQLDALRATAR